MVKADNVGVQFDNKLVLSDVTFAINPGERIGLVGPNGVGKTTLLRVLAGLLEPTQGHVIKPPGIRMQYLPQELTQWQNLSIEDYLKSITGITQLEDELSALSVGSDQIPGYLDSLQSVLDKLERHGAYTFDIDVHRALAQVGLGSVDLGLRIGSLSGGQRTRLSMASVLLARQDVLLLDEPTNNLDLEGLQLLESFVCGSQSAFVLVSHDRRFLRRVATKIVSLECGRPGVEIYSLGYDEFMEARRKRRLSAIREYEKYQEEKERLRSAYTDKVRASHRASNNKERPDNEKIAHHAAREKAVGSHSAAARAILTRADQMAEPERPKKTIDLDISFHINTGHVGDMVADLADAEMHFAGSNKTIGPFRLSIRSGDRLVLVGPNGGGKTTLLKLIAGLLLPTAGTVTLCPNVRVGIVDQDQSFPLPEASLLENTREMVNTGSDEPMPEGRIRQILAMFNLGAESIGQSVGELSPGERSRALLGALVARGTNLLLLDEPTNHLDIDASEELETALSDYSGTFLIISHDREFIHAVRPTKVLCVNNGRFQEGLDIYE